VRLILLAFSTFAMLGILTAAFFSNSVFHLLFNAIRHNAPHGLAVIGV
jgi:hypothetical protein